MANQLPALSLNGKKLIEQLLNLPKGWMTADALAKSIGVSRRTVLRELPGVETWMKAADARLIRSPGKGIMLDEDEDVRMHLLALLSGKKGTEVFNKTERRQRLLILLLNSREPVKSWSLAYDLGVSESVLAGDLNKVESWLEPMDVKLHRQSGVGIWLEGEPEKLRKAVGRLLCSQLPREEVDSFFHNRKTSGSIISRLLNPEIAEKICTVLTDFEQETGLHFTDAGFLMLAVHFALYVQQLKSGYWEEDGKTDVAADKNAMLLLKKLEETFAVHFPSGQAGYTTCYLDAYCSRRQEEEPDSFSMELRYYASVLIHSMEQELDMDFSELSSLTESLCSHIRPMLYRLRRGEVSDNPQITLIQKEYPLLWQATRRACDTAWKLTREYDTPIIPDSEACFLAMHFGAAAEQVAEMRKHLSVIVVCPYGMASSRFLSSQLSREFSSLIIESTCSARNLTLEYLKKHGADLVVSTVPLRIDFPTVCVQPVLQKLDIAVLRNVIEELQEKNRGKKNSRNSKTEENTFDVVKYAADMNDIIYSMLNRVQIRTVDVPSNRYDFIHQASGLFTEDPSRSSQIEEALIRREQMGDTYVKPLHALLLHCITDSIDGCCLGYLNAVPPVYEKGKIIQGALVLLAGIDEENIPLTIMQSVSELLIDDEKIIKAFRKGHRTEVVARLEIGLEKKTRAIVSERLK